MPGQPNRPQVLCQALYLEQARPLRILHLTVDGKPEGNGRAGIFG